MCITVPTLYRHKAYSPRKIAWSDFQNLNCYNIVYANEHSWTSLICANQEIYYYY